MLIHLDHIDLCLSITLVTYDRQLSIAANGKRMIQNRLAMNNAMII